MEITAMRIEASNTDYVDAEFPSFKAFRDQYPHHEAFVVDGRIVVGICAACNQPVLDEGEVNGVQLPADEYDETPEEVITHKVCPGTE